MLKTPLDLTSFEQRSDQVAKVLKELGNGRRLMLLCKLVEYGERTVSDLADDIGLSQSALSQHLARMREEGLVGFRRERQTIWYRIVDPRIESLLAKLHQLYCVEAEMPFTTTACEPGIEHAK